MADPLAQAVEHHRAGRRAEAEALYRRVLAAEPDNAEALQLLGVLTLQGGDAEAAAGLIRRAVEIDPTRPGHHFNLGAALAALGDRDGAMAAYREALALRPDDAEAHANLGHLLRADGRPEAAVDAFDRALRLDPAHEAALFGRGAAHAATDRLGRAERDFRALLAARPDHAAALNRLGGVLIRQARLDEAIELLTAGHARHPENADLLANLASACEARNDLEAAEDAARRAAALNPEALGPRLLLARLDHRRGRRAEARGRLEAILALAPGDAQRCEALFELGQVLDGLGEADAAYRAFAEANALHAGSPAARRFDGRRFLARIEANRAAFAGPGLAALRARVAQAPDGPPDGAPDGDGRPPVFFVGFPRSGTTLLERALSAHPEIVTTQERSPLAPAVRHLIGPGGMADHRGGTLDGLDEARVAEARALFRREAEAVAGPLDGRLLVDKLPLNLVDLGYASLLFPEAKALVALRDPRDVCLSCFMQRFQPNDSMIGFSSLAGTVETYAAAMGLWLACRDKLGLAWREVRYEDLIEDFEAVLRGLLEFLGLDWDDSVARYRERAGRPAVSTPSYRQVDREIYRDSIGRWKRYRAPLAPLLPALAPFLDAFGYPRD